MEEATDGHLVAKLVVALHCFFGLKHIKVNVVVGQQRQCFGTDLQAFPYALRQHHSFGAMIDQFLYIGRLNAGAVPSARRAMAESG